MLKEQPDSSHRLITPKRKDDTIAMPSSGKRSWPDERMKEKHGASQARCTYPRDPVHQNLRAMGQILAIISTSGMPMVLLAWVIVQCGINEKVRS